MSECIVFWQRMLTPHMTELARELALGGAVVHYVAEEPLSAERQAMGWHSDSLEPVTVHFVKTPQEARALVAHFPPAAVHITQGVRSNGLVAEAQKQIAARGLRHFPIMEQVDVRGIKGWVKPLVYALRFWQIAKAVEGILAIGDGTPEWIARRAPRRLRVFPFAYFLKGRAAAAHSARPDVFRFAFVGSLIGLKSIDLLIEALAGLSGQSFELVLVGDGPERARLAALAAARLPERVTFAGTLAMQEAVAQMALADCLVLPSSHDGFGAVLSEAQINGTPVVCSSRCGASGTVRASGVGAVFSTGNLEDLRRCLAQMLERGRVDMAKRERLALWAQCLTAKAGAQYLSEILCRDPADHSPILPPWQRERTAIAEAEA